MSPLHLGLLIEETAPLTVKNGEHLLIGPHNSALFVELWTDHTAELGFSL